MAYVDGFLLIVPTDKLGEYKKISTKAGKIWREHGAQGYVETSGDDMAVEGMQHFPKLMKAKDNETVVFSWIFYASKAERNRVNKLVMKDPRMVAFTKQPMPFDMKKMYYGGFKTLVTL